MAVFFDDLLLCDPTKGDGPGNGALSLSPTHGFAVDAQPHPWNVRSDPPQVFPLDNELISQCVTLLVGGKHRILAARDPPGGWSSAGIDGLAQIALDALVGHHALIRFHLRATPEQLLRPYVLPNLSLLELIRLDVLAGTINSGSLKQMGSLDTQQTIEECCFNIAKLGLSSVTRLLFVLGLPGENGEDAVRTVQFAFRLMLMNGIRTVRFEWWKTAAVMSPDFLLTSATLSKSDRSSIRETIEFVGLLHKDFEIVGPDEPAMP